VGTVYVFYTVTFLPHCLYEQFGSKEIGGKRKLNIAGLYILYFWQYYIDQMRSERSAVESVRYA
jgi:hypothetical protein